MRSFLYGLSNIAWVRGGGGGGGGKMGMNVDKALLER